MGCLADGDLGINHIRGSSAFEGLCRRGGLRGDEIVVGDGPHAAAGAAHHPAAACV